MIRSSSLSAALLGACAALASVTAVAAITAIPASAQAQARGDFTWSKAMPAGSVVQLSNVNGDIHVTPSTSGKVEVVGTKHGSSRDFDEIKANVEETSNGVQICVVQSDAGSGCSDHSRWHGNNHWDDVSMNLEVRVPANVNVSVSSVSGDVTVDGAQGRIEANTVSGDLHLSHLRAESIRANSVSGDIDVATDALTGSGDLSFHSVSGDITLDLPPTLDADLSLTTVSGDLDSDYEMTLSNGRMNHRRVEARIGRGGRRIDVSTVSGDLRLRKTR